MLLNSLATSIANRLFDEDDRYPMDVYVYGIELIISSLIGTVLVMAVGLITKTFLECVIYMAVFALIRSFTGGYHAMTYLRCNIITVASYLLVYLTTRFLGEVLSHPAVFVSGYILMVVMCLLFAPVRNENKELTQEDRKKYKLLSLLTVTVVYGISAVLMYVWGITIVRIITPTCLAVDVAMVVAIIIDRKNNRRNTHEKYC